ncbi:hypothetical protein ENH_00008120 [Eimeria necatrix]|uniref:Uncharacterized protein n=1 Tax=Eimeria necatrix TaxID=51315 RepID=U6MIE8_9EIME|nr:hypothetical protein ENH_00008120 [Eimeria necatrix]CDJ62224.1 hypothetical protein ENH_00008120 [Eimeria necatrix]
MAGAAAARGNRFA